MLSRSRRLSAGQLMEVMEKGRVQHSPLFLVRIMPAPAGANGRAAITKVAAIVPKKVARTAVMRNRMRRRIYTAARDAYPSISTPSHIAVFAKSAALDADTNSLIAGLKDIFGRSRPSVAKGE